MRTPASIVLAAWQGEPYLRQQIESIQRQMQDKDELIVSVDPSSDKTLEIAQNMARHDGRIQVISGPGQGVIANFSNAAAKAENPIVFFADQDDVWLEGKMDAMAAAFDDPDVLAAVHDCSVCDGNLNVKIPSFFEEHGISESYSSNFIRNGFMGCCMAVRNAFLRRLLPLDASIPMHDQFIGLMALKNGKAAWINTPYLLYRRHGGNATGTEKSSLKQKITWRVNLYKAIQNAQKRLES